MSKIFEALQQRSSGEPDDLLHRLFERTETESAPPAPPPPDSEPVPTVQLPPPPAPPALPASERVRPGVRMLPIRVAASAPLFPFDLGENYSAEQYKIIRTKLVQHPRRPCLLLISSAGPADGKSVTAINLAASLSLKTEGRVLLVDGDFRRASIHTQLGLPDSPGLSDVLAGEATLDDAIVQAEQFPNLYVLPAGRVRPNSVELLDSTRWPELCATFKREFRHVLIDSSPVGAVAEYHLLQAAVDGVVLVVRPDHTPRKLVFSALEFVPKEKLVGVVLNHVEDWFLGGLRSQHYGYYYTRLPRAQAKSL